MTLIVFLCSTIGTPPPSPITTQIMLLLKCVTQHNTEVTVIEHVAQCVSVSDDWHAAIVNTNAVEYVTQHSTDHVAQCDYVSDNWHAATVNTYDAEYARLHRRGWRGQQKRRNCEIKRQRERDCSSRHNNSHAHRHKHNQNRGLLTQSQAHRHNQNRGQLSQRTAALRILINLRYRNSGTQAQQKHAVTCVQGTADAASENDTGTQAREQHAYAISAAKEIYKKEYWVARAAVAHEKMKQVQQVQQLQKVQRQQQQTRQQQHQIGQQQQQTGQQRRNDEVAYKAAAAEANKLTADMTGIVAWSRKILIKTVRRISKFSDSLGRCMGAEP